MLNENTLIELSRKFNEPTEMYRRRTIALNNFTNFSNRSLKYGIKISVDLSKLDFNKINPTEKQDENFVISQQSAEIINLRQAIIKYPALINKYFMENYSGIDENKFSFLHDAFFNNGIFIRIPENECLDSPLQIVLDMKSSTRIENIFVLAEKNSKVRIIEVIKSQAEEKQIYKSQMVKIIVKENASVEYFSAQNLNKKAYNLCFRRAEVEQNGSIYWVDYNLGSAFTQLSILSNLNGVGSTSRNQGIVFGDDEQCFDIKNTTIHVASKTVSNMATRVVLSDKAKTVYRGLIKVNQNSLNCEGYQKDDTILLSEDAHADIVPNLEIGNNEVKCSHGATVSQLDEEKIFYMMSRGLSKVASKKAIIEGFFYPLITKIENEKLEREIVSSLSKRLEVLN